ncbi:MAG: threonine synthase [Ruminococcaceae bacterium]|nr:threonine synthase [Oscillospiraceae bacterium]MBE6706137.1 threonine synthase [Oscillospiraceae bacterium]
MKYFSTRDAEKKSFDSAVVIKKGLASDGGLFVPDSLPSLTREDIEKLCGLSYPERAATVLSKYLTDYTYDELLADCEKAYCESSFPGGAAPLRKVTDTLYSLELWHGPTAAFKDMALQIMPRLLSRALTKTGEKNTALILVATSGDTGKAALEGYKDVDGVKIMVFYPISGVSKVQKLQMVTQTGNNVNVCAIEGNFDDAQSGVKKIFSDEDAKKILLENSYILSSANSINWGRLAPQIVYYVSAYCDMLNSGEVTYGETVNVCVPTGNFGNIFAAYLAKLMGLPIGKLICASNDNNVLTEFLSSGTYNRNRTFHTTISPSMDILISSNLERLLYFTAGSEKTATYMKQLSENGAYTVSEEIMSVISENFDGYFADETSTRKTLKHFYDDYGYLADTHTSVALDCAEQYISKTGDTRKMIVASTASPYKFAADVYEAIAHKKASADTGALDDLSALTNTEITYPLKGLAERKVNFDTVIPSEDMLKEVYKFM